MIATGIQKLDQFLSGGIPSGVIVDIFGGNGTGKTLLLLQLSINSIKNGGNVLYLDTTGGFRPERILEIQQESNADLLEKITVSRVTNTSEQIKSIASLKDSFSLIVIDNITDLFSYEYNKDQSIFEKNSVFTRHMHEISQYSITKKIPIVITNMIRHTESGEAENMQSAIDPFTHIKIHLSKNSSKFSGQIYWALKKASFAYTINKTGMSDKTEDF